LGDWGENRSNEIFVAVEHAIQTEGKNLTRLEATQRRGKMWLKPEDVLFVVPFEDRTVRVTLNSQQSPSANKDRPPEITKSFELTLDPPHLEEVECHVSYTSTETTSVLKKLGGRCSPKRLVAAAVSAFRAKAKAAARKGSDLEILKRFLQRAIKLREEEDAAPVYQVFLKDRSVVLPQPLLAGDLASCRKGFLLPPKDRDFLISDLQRFWESKAAYDSVGQVWKRGYFLSGPPGGGKTSIVRTLARVFRMSLLVFNPAAYVDDTKFMADAMDFAGRPGRKCVLMEDIGLLFNNIRK
jgi:hypothetical protein